MGLTPTEQEYITLHSELVKDDRIYCECGASNIRLSCNSGYVCAVCNAMLFVAGKVTLTAKGD